MNRAQINVKINLMKDDKHDDDDLLTILSIVVVLTMHSTDILLHSFY